MSKNGRSAFICDFVGCNKYFKEPIALPCGDTICKEHVNSLNTTIKCPICDEEFVVPEEGFRINIKMSSLISKNSQLTGQHKQVKDLFYKLEIMIDNFQ
jgi:hypothetical protein